MGVVQQIWNFFAGKGLAPAQVAGIMANLEVESGDSPTASNPNEGAIGLAQWEGGRRTALQAFAAQRGTSETDLETQLEFLWQELNTSESGALAQIRATSTAGDAAAAFDQYYERSSGAARAQRVDDANSYFNSFSSGGVNGLASPAGASETLLTSATTSGTATALTADDYKSALGDLASLLTSVPELKGVLNQAVSNHWSLDKFHQEVQQTSWWKANNDSAKQLLALKANDPAEYNTRVTNATSQVQNLAQQMGVTLSASALKSLTQQFMVQGWDNQNLSNQIGLYYTANENPKSLSGQAASLYQQLQTLYSDYGIPLNNTSINGRVRTILDGKTTIDAYKQVAAENAKSLYPSLSSQIDSGLTVKQIADPYIQTMSNILELDPNTITVQDPLIKKALQGSVVTTGGKTTATSTTLYDFEKTLRADPRWGYTQNAKDAVSTGLVKVGQDWGFSV